MSEIRRSDGRKPKDRLARCRIACHRRRRVRSAPDTRNRTPTKGLHNQMQKKSHCHRACSRPRRTRYAPSASADLPVQPRPTRRPARGIPRLCLTAANANSTWGDDPGEEDDHPREAAVRHGRRQAHDPSRRHRPRQSAHGASPPARVLGGTPGRDHRHPQRARSTGRARARRTGVIIMTTAAVDNNGDLQPDDFDGNGFEDPYPGTTRRSRRRRPDACRAPAAQRHACDPDDDCVGTDRHPRNRRTTLSATACVDATPTFHDDDSARRAARAADPADQPGSRASGRTASTAPSTTPVETPTSRSGAASSSSARRRPTPAERRPRPSATPATTSSRASRFRASRERVATYGGVRAARQLGDRPVRLGAPRRRRDRPLERAQRLHAGAASATARSSSTTRSTRTSTTASSGSAARVNSNHLMVSHVGDDSFDTDQGYSGVSSSAFRSRRTSTSSTATAWPATPPRVASTAPSRGTR